MSSIKEDVGKSADWIAKALEAPATARISPHRACGRLTASLRSIVRMLWRSPVVFEQELNEVQGHNTTTNPTRSP